MLGDSQFSLGQLERTVDLYEKSLGLCTELGHKEGMAHAHKGMGYVYKTRGELNQARESWQRSEQLFQEIGSPNAMQVQAWIDELDAE